MEVELLGAVRVAGTPLTSPTQSLLVSVLAAAGGPVPFTRLIDAVWGAAPPPEAENSLHSHLSRLRRRLGSGSIERRDDTYLLAAETDVARFERDIGHAPAGVARRTRLEGALAMWRGEPFGVHAGHPFLVGAAARLDELRRLAGRELAALDLATGRSTEALAACRALVERDPTDERAWVIVVEALDNLGRRRDGLLAAHEARAALAAVGLEPSTELLAAEAAAAHGHERTLVSVPHPQGEMVGRAAELSAIEDVLEDPGWLSLVGPGGVGKTRLALEVANDGSVATSFVDLGQADQSDVSVAIARAVGAPLRPPYPQRIAERIGRDPHRIVLDGCELVAETVAEVGVALRAACPELRVLATSRSPVGLPGERILDVGPLDDADAVTLLVGHARLSGVVPPDEGLAKALCGAVDKLPLNIEMIAASLRSFSAATLLDALGDPVEVLGGPEGRLVAGVERSLSLLTEEELSLFEQLSLFRRPFTVEAAAELVGLPSVVHRLQRLRDLSLLEPVGTPTGHRLRMLDTVRAAARRSLERRADTDEPIRNYVRALRARGGEIASGLRSRDELRWVAVAETEIPELRAAHRAAIALDDAAGAMEIPVTLFTLAYDRLRADLASWAEESLEHFGLDDDGAMAAAAVAALGAMHEDDHDRARRHLTLVPPDARGPGTHFGHLVAANLHLRDGDLDALRRRARRASEEAAAADDAYLAIVAEVVHGLGSFYGGDDEEAQECCRRVRRAVGRLPAPTLLAYADYLEGELLSERRPEEGLELLRRAYARAVASGSTLAEGVALVTVTSVQSRIATAESARSAGRDLERAVRHWRTHQDWNLQWSTLRNVVVFLESAGAHDHAAVLAGAIDAGSAAAYGLEARRYSQAVERVHLAIGDDAARLRAGGRSLVGDEILEAAFDGLATVQGAAARDVVP